MKRTIAKFVLLTSLILSAYSIVGAVATQGKDGPIGQCPPPYCLVAQSVQK